MALESTVWSARCLAMVQISRSKAKSASLTLDTYRHVIPGMQEDAVARIDAVFGSALLKPRARSVWKW
jgi:hypothetical protein